MIINEILSLSKAKHVKGRRYSHEWLLTCFLLHIRSPRTYTFLRESGILPLPCHSTICSYLQNSNVGCGFDKNFFSLFSEEVRLLPDLAKNGILSFDEIQVRTALDVNVKNMTFDGLIDFGYEEGDEEEENESDKKIDENEETCTDLSDVQADHALVFLYSSLAQPFHQPVGMFTCKGATKSTKLVTLIVAAIISIEQAGAKVHAVVCDGASTNRGIWNHFGIEANVNEPVKCSFENPFDKNRQVYFISDAPHLLKCVRNNLYNRRTFKVSHCFLLTISKHLV